MCMFSSNLDCTRRVSGGCFPSDGREGNHRTASSASTATAGERGSGWMNVSKSKDGPCHASAVHRPPARVRTKATRRPPYARRSPKERNGGNFPTRD